MLSTELQNDFLSNLPNSITLNDHDISVHKRYANQFVGDEFPTITLMYYNTGVVNYIYLNEVYKTSNESIDEFTYNKNEFELETPSPNEILKVMGYVDDNYVEVSDNYYDLILADDTGYITFNRDLDDETQFEVKYKHDTIKAEYGGEFSDYVQLDVYTKDIKIGDDYINGILLNKAIVRNLEKQIRFNLDNENYVIRDVTNASDFSDISGEEYVYRRQFDVEIAYHDTFVEYHDKMEEVNYVMNTQVR